MSKVSEITPIKGGMTKDQAKNATKHFLQDIVTSQNVLRVKDIATQDSKNCGVRSYTLITMNDGSKWVPGSEGIERLIGAHYLKKNLAIEGWSVVETKCFLKNEQESKIVVKYKSAENKPLQNIMTIQSADFISVSKYVGDKKPQGRFGGNPKLGEGNIVISSTGFNDFSCQANLREQEDGSIIIIDTEYSSFTSDGVPPISDETNLELAGVEFTFDTTDFFG